MHPITPTKLHECLGHFVLSFQAVEAAMVELIVQLIPSDPEYVATLTAELEFTAKARALDVIFTRFAQIHGLSTQSPDKTFHSLANRIQTLASRRNEIVHSFYHLLLTVDGEIALERRPTKLKPSEGLSKQAPVDILPKHLEMDILEMRKILLKLEEYRLAAIHAENPE